MHGSMNITFKELLFERARTRYNNNNNNNNVLFICEMTVHKRLIKEPTNIEQNVENIKHKNIN